MSLQCCADTNEFRSDTDSNHLLPILSTPLSGRIGGKAWTASRAVARPELRTSTTLFVEASSEDRAEPCRNVGIVAPSLLFTVPSTPGNYPFTHTLNAAFLLDDASQTNLATSRGRIEVLDAGDGNVEVGITAEFDESNRVSGRISIDVCPE